MESTGIRRIIFETSCMLNNEEIFIHCDEEVNIDTFVSEVKRLKSIEGERPRIRAIRYVSNREVEDGLDITRDYTSNDVWNNPCLFPDSTRALDALAKLMQDMSFYTKYLHQEVGISIIKVIASNFYDCMSSGCSPFYLAACRYLLEKYEVNPEEEVYPYHQTNDNGEVTKGWHTVADFFDEIKDIPRFEQGLLKDLPALLSP